MADESMNDKVVCVGSTYRDKPGFLEYFENTLSFDEDRFVVALRIVVEYAAYFIPSECIKKNSEDSKVSREDGNKCFKERQNYKAVQKYTKSVMFAVDSSEELALAYANRSAALFDLEKFEECIKDIDRALTLTYPDRLKTKLYKRKGLCLKKLGRPDAESSFLEALAWLDKTGLNEDAMSNALSELRTLISADDPAAKPPINVIQLPLPKVLQPNSEVPCASDAVAIKYSEKFGRHLVATRRIKPGEILSVEKPYCISLMAKNIYTHCSYCLQVSWNMIPCKCCANVAYCSEACRDKAWAQYHEVECPLLGFLCTSNLEDMYTYLMGLRMVLMESQNGRAWDSFKQELINCDRNKDPRTRGFSEDGKFLSDRYRSIHSLSSNTDRDSRILLERFIWVALIVYLAGTETNMFGEKLTRDTLPNNQHVLFVGKLLLHHVHICHINLDSFGACRSEYSEEHGRALMALTSLVNHSCDPNSFRQWYGDRIVIIALHPIKAGEQIFRSYGPVFTQMEKNERHITLQYYKFNCECIACVKNWPTAQYLRSYKEQPLSQKNRKILDQAMPSLHRYYNGSVLRKTALENSKGVLDQVSENIEVFFKLARRPCRQMEALIELLMDIHLLAEEVYAYEPTDSSVRIILS